MEPTNFFFYAGNAKAVNLGIFGEGEYAVSVTGQDTQWFADFNTARRAFFKACEAACPSVPLAALTGDPRTNPDSND